MSRAIAAGMPRRIRLDNPSYFHVLNRSVRRARLFDQPSDYESFMNALGAAQARVPMPLLAYCIMPNHFHLIVGPALVVDLSRFMHRLTVIHAMRWHRYKGTAGTGPVYQGRFKALPIQGETHFLFVCRYVERNPVRAGLVDRADRWAWSSLAPDRKNCHPVTLSAWPIPKPSGWRKLMNEPETGSLKGPGLLEQS
jgi:putative transposase